MESTTQVQDERIRKTKRQADADSFTCQLFYFTMKAATVALFLKYKNILTQQGPIWYSILYIAILAINSYLILTIGKNPGYNYSSQTQPIEEVALILPPQQQQQQEQNTCQICRNKKRNRMKHCYKCGKCVMKFDHHCPWIGACVGQLNHFKFLTFLFFQMIQSSWTFYIFICSLKFYEYKGQQDQHFSSQFGAYAIFATFMLFYSLGMIALFTFHAFLILSNLTTRELVSSHKAPYLKQCKGRNPFNNGVYQNVKMAIYPPLGGCQWEIQPIDGSEQSQLTTEKSLLQTIWSNQYYNCC